MNLNKFKAILKNRSRGGRHYNGADDILTVKFSRHQVASKILILDIERCIKIDFLRFGFAVMLLAIHPEMVVL